MALKHIFIPFKIANRHNSLYSFFLHHYYYLLVLLTIMHMIILLYYDFKTINLTEQNGRRQKKDLRS